LKYDFKRGDPRYEELAREVAEKLVKEDTLHVAKQGLDYVPVRLALGPHLRKIIIDRSRPQSERVLAARLHLHNLTANTASLHDLLVDLLLDTEGKDYNESLEWFTAEPEHAAESMRKVLDEGRRPGASEDDTKRLAHAAVVLLQLAQLDARIQA